LQFKKVVASAPTSIQKV